jgi:hypothetical protein
MLSARVPSLLALFTCFTGTKIQILTPEELRGGATQVEALVGQFVELTVLSLPAFLVRKYNY